MTGVVAGEAFCQSGGLNPSSQPNSQAPDLLREEEFGGLYYSRRTCEFFSIPPQFFELLKAARHESILTAFAKQKPTISDRRFVETVVRWQSLGWLDADYRCPAQLVPRVGEGRVLTGPMVTHLQLTHACNLRCSHCYVSIVPKPPPDELDTEMMLSLFSELKRLGSPVLVMAGGEPMIRPDFWELVEGLRTYDLDAWLCTNATLIRDEQAERIAASVLRGISVSLDGPDAETHDAIRGEKRFKHAMRGIRALVKAGARDIQIRVTVTKTNAHTLLDYAPLATELGVDKIVFKPFRQTGEASGQDDLFISRSHYLQAIDHAREHWPETAPQANFGDGIPARPPAWTKIIPEFGCVGGNTSVTINAKGEVVGCGPVLSPDDWKLSEVSFGEAWHHAPTLQSWRHLEGNDSCHSCGQFKKCGGGCRARALGVGNTINDKDPWSFCSETSSDTESSPKEWFRPLPIHSNPA